MNATLDFTYTNVHNRVCIQRLELSYNGDHSYQLFVNDGRLKFDVRLTKRTIEALVEALKSNNKLVANQVALCDNGYINVAHHKTTTMIIFHVSDDYGFIDSELTITHDNVDELIKVLEEQ